MRDLCIYDEVTYVDGSNLVKSWVIDLLSDGSVQVEDADGNRTWIKKSDIRKVRD